MCLKKHKTCCSSSDRHFWSFWRITSISICITIITISTSFISFTKCFTSFSRFQPFHWSGFTGFPTFTLSCICPSFTSDKLSTSPCFSYQVPLQRVGSTHTLSTQYPTWAPTVNIFYSDVPLSLRICTSTDLADNQMSKMCKKIFKRLPRTPQKSHWITQKRWTDPVHCLIWATGWEMPLLVQWNGWVGGWCQKEKE